MVKNELISNNSIQNCGFNICSRLERISIGSLKFLFLSKSISRLLWVVFGYFSHLSCCRSIVTNEVIDELVQFFFVSSHCVPCCWSINLGKLSLLSLTLRSAHICDCCHARCFFGEKIKWINISSDKSLATLLRIEKSKTVFWFIYLSFIGIKKWFLQNFSIFWKFWKTVKKILIAIPLSVEWLFSVDETAKSSTLGNFFWLASRSSRSFQTMVTHRCCWNDTSISLNVHQICNFRWLKI